MRLELQRVYQMPKELKPGVLYVSDEFETAAHLCPCGCGEKVRTPLGPTEWTFTETSKGPTLNPSIGNWQKACKSHYFIRQGEIVWAEEWTSEQITMGRHGEEKRRQVYYEAINHQQNGILRRAWLWLKNH